MKELSWFFFNWKASSLFYGREASWSSLLLYCSRPVSVVESNVLVSKNQMGLLLNSLHELTCTVWEAITVDP